MKYPISAVGRGGEPPVLGLLQAVRGLAALAVLMEHDILPPLPGQPSSFRSGVHGWGWIGVDVFFCLSGFVMAWVHGNDLGSPAKARSFALKRFFRIYPPYAVFLVITWILGAASTFTGHPPASPHPFFSWIQSILLLPPYDGLVIGASWTLVHETFFYILFCGAILLGPRVARAGAALWILGIVAYPYPTTVSPFCDFLFSPVHLEFLLGIGAAMLARRPSSPVWIAAAGMVCAVILGVGFATDWFHNAMGLKIPFSLGEKAALAVALSSLLFALARIEAIARPRVPAPLLFLGAASYSIYLVHGSIIRWLGYGVRRIAPDHSLWIEAFPLGAAAVAILIGIAFHLAAERPLLRYFRNWIGSARPSATEIPR